MKKSSSPKPLPPIEREQFIERIAVQLMSDEITQGQALNSLRLNVLAMTQVDFARLVGLSKATISNFENDKSFDTYSIKIVNQLFKIFGMKFGIIPHKIKNLQRILNFPNDDPEMMTRKNSL